MQATRTCCRTIRYFISLSLSPLCIDTLNSVAASTTSHSTPSPFSPPIVRCAPGLLLQEQQYKNKPKFLSAVIEDVEKRYAPSKYYIYKILVSREGKVRTRKRANEVYLASNLAGGFFSHFVSVSLSLFLPISSSALNGGRAGGVRDLSTVQPV